MFVVWIIMGALIYATYGYGKNRKVERMAEEKEITINDEKVEYSTK